MTTAEQEILTNIRRLYVQGRRGSEISARLGIALDYTERAIHAFVTVHPRAEIEHYAARGRQPKPKARFVIQDDQHYERVNRFDAR